MSNISHIKSSRVGPDWNSTESIQIEIQTSQTYGKFGSLQPNRVGQNLTEFERVDLGRNWTEFDWVSDDWHYPIFYFVYLFIFYWYFYYLFL